MKAEARKILQFLDYTKKLRIPIYQRAYSWRQAECAQLWDDIVAAGRDPHLEEHFLGAIVFVTDAQSLMPEVMIIDGQQRLTTITLLLSALTTAIGTDKVANLSAPLLREFFVNEKFEGEDFYKLHLTRADRATLMSIVAPPPGSGGVHAPLPQDVSLRILENHAFFVEQLQDKSIIEPLCRGLQKLMIVEIGLDGSKSNPQLIFESMNSTGLDLTQADLIRNYVLMGLPQVQQEQLYMHYWAPMEAIFSSGANEARFDSFIRHYLTFRTGEIPKQRQIYQDFKAHARRVQVEKKDVARLVEDLHRSAMHYGFVMSPKSAATDLPVDKDLRDALHNLHELKVDVVHPFLLRVLDDFRLGTLQLDALKEIVKTCESYIFRRIICGLPTNSHNKTFAGLAKLNTTGGYIEAFRKAIHGMVSYKRMPGDGDFIRELTVKDLYNVPWRAYWMRRLENHDKKEIVEMIGLQVEHIMPQQLSEGWRKALGREHTVIHERYLHTIGNLTLTAANAALGNRTFTDKVHHKDGFAASSLRLNKGLSAVTTWGEAEIAARADRLALLAAKVWAPPPKAAILIEVEGSKGSTDSSDWRIEDHPQLVEQEAAPRKLFDALGEALMALDPNITMHVQKQYIAFRAEGNFTCVIPQKSRLRIRLSLRLDELEDPLGVVEDTSQKGGWGTGFSDVILKTPAELPYVVGLCEQAFLAQMGEQDAG